MAEEDQPRVRLLVGQHAATSLPDHGDYSCYDLVVSSFPPTVEFFQRKGIPAVLHRLGFDPEVSCRRRSRNAPIRSRLSAACPPFTGAGSNGSNSCAPLCRNCGSGGRGPICWTRHRRFAGVIWASCGGTRCTTFSCVRRLHSIITATWPPMRTTAACSKRPAQRHVADGLESEFARSVRCGTRSGSLPDSGGLRADDPTLLGP